MWNVKYGALVLITLVSLTITGCITDEGSTTTEVAVTDNSGQSTDPGTTPADSTTTTTTTSSTTSTLPSGDNCTALPGIVSGGTISINQGALYTSSLSVHLDIFFDEPKLMKISSDENCACGNWQRYATSKDFTLPASNQKNVVSIQFLNYEGVASQCSKAYIIHDTMAPSLSLSLDSANTYLDGTSTSINIQAADYQSGIKSISCDLGGAPVACSLDSSGSAKVSFSSQAVGSYQFNSSVTDLVGNVTSQSISWTMKEVVLKVTQSVDVKTNRKVDILIIDDNSGSMQYEQQSMAKRMSTFLSELTGLDWRIAITTTDPVSKTWGDGRFLPISGLSNQYYITSSMDPAMAQTALAGTIQRPETGSGDEQAIYATYRVLERALAAGDSPQKSFLRSDANFAALVISDEDESETKEKNIPENLINFFHTNWADKKFLWSSIITIPGDTACKSGNGATYGSIYQRLSQLTNFGSLDGVTVGSVCANDYGSQLTGIAKNVQNLLKSITLTCEPIGPNNSSVQVSKDGASFNQSYVVNGKQIVFDTYLDDGNYKLDYICKK